MSRLSNPQKESQHPIFSFLHCSKRNRRLYRAFIMASSLLLSACATHKQPAPLIDDLPYKDKSLSYAYINNSMADQEIAEHQKPLVVLTIDGGGMGGLIPLEVLSSLQNKLHRPLTRYANLIFAACSGSIIATYLTIPNSETHHVGTPAELLAKYKHQGRRIFNRPLSYKIQTVWGIRGPLYPPGVRKAIYKHVFSDSTLAQSTVHLRIPRYSLSRDRVEFFDSDKAKKNANANYNVAEMLTAATSSPVAFKPNYYCNLTHTFCDRGFSSLAIENDPAITAYLYARDKYPKRDIILVSLGSGMYKHPNNPIRENFRRADWGISALRPSITAMTASIEIKTDAQMRKIARLPDSHVVAYFRFNQKIPKGVTTHDPSDKSFTEIENTALQLTHQQNNKLNQLAQLLKKVC